MRVDFECGNLRSIEVIGKIITRNLSHLSGTNCFIVFFLVLTGLHLHPWIG